MSIPVILIANIVLIVLFVYATYRIYTELNKRDQIIRGLQKDLSALCAGASGVSGHLSRVDQQVKRMIERQDKVEIQDPENRMYHQAIKMIRKGASAEELTSTCGLVRSEAELLILMHRQNDRDTKGYHSAA